MQKRGGNRETNEVKERGDRPTVQGDSERGSLSRVYVKDIGRHVNASCMHRKKKLQSISDRDRPKQ